MQTAVLQGNALYVRPDDLPLLSYSVDPTSSLSLYRRWVDHPQVTVPANDLVMRFRRYSQNLERNSYL